ncbi:MAG: hypothetical protein GEV03_06435 [Streptosporangiales bacterium]|nr:hypothetical protein [Streptosporangiales bacterium]
MHALAGDGAARCPGSAQRIRLGVSPGEWLRMLDVARRAAATRSGRWTYRRGGGVDGRKSGRKLVRRTGKPSAVPPVFRVTTVVMVLQRFEGLSDREAVEQFSGRSLT